MHCVGVIGAGTMGAGIAQVAATAGWRVRLRDVDLGVVETAIEGVQKRLERLVEKQRMTPGEAEAAAQRLLAADHLTDLADCELIIEAVVENLDVKAAVFGALLPHLETTTVLASNTSSLSVSDLGRAIGEPRRTVGMHFFNPAPLMKLVEVVAGSETSPEIVDRTAGIAESWGKVVARAADVPGFIVNHVARPYYLEAFRILEDRLATVTQIDEACKRLAGFRMGPLELTDLIGQDVNTATTRSVWEKLGHPPLLHPSELQERLVAEGHLGRKTGRGVYRYPESGEPVPALEIETRPLEASAELREALSAFAAAVLPEGGSELEHYILARIIAALIVQAEQARQRGVASPEDIDTALKYGTNYPAGPFEWSARLGEADCAKLLEALEAPSPGLIR